MSPKPRRSVAIADLLVLTAMCLGCAALLWWGNRNTAMLGRSSSAGGDSGRTGSSFDPLEASSVAEWWSAAASDGNAKEPGAIEAERWLWPVSDPAAESPDGPDCAPAGAPFVVDDQCRPVPVTPGPVTQSAGPRPGRAPGERSGEGAPARVASDQPTLAPPEPMELAEGRQVIVVQVEADQAADGSDVRQR
jgi:hypothetical protein